MLYLLYTLKQGLCPLVAIHPKHPLSIQVKTPRGAIAKGSIMRLDPWKDCPDNKIYATLISQVYFYQKSNVKLLEQGDSLCLSLEYMQPTDNLIIYLLHPPPDELGFVLEDVGVDWGRDASCAPFITINEISYSDEILKWGYAMQPEHALHLLELQQKWIVEFGSWILGRIWINHWDRIALPLQYYSQEERLREYKREHLYTRKQKSKAIIGRGPQQLWLHFLGSDAPYSDIWAEEQYLSSTIELTRTWQQKCMDDDKIDNKRACTTQIGDISWYNPTRPDPLGHQKHSRGQCVDLRLFRKDASRYESYWNRKDDRKGKKKGYSLYMNRQYIQSLKTYNVTSILFGDTRTGASWASKHDDHIHFCLSE